MERRVIGLLLAACLASAACGPSDPLERVRQQQDAEGDFAGSLEPLRELLATRPDDPEVHLRHGLALIATGNPTDAIWSLRKALTSPDWVLAAAVPLAEAYAALGSYDDAIETWDVAVEHAPENARLRVGRGMARIQSRRHYEEALADADRALELDEEDVAARILRALALLGMERAEEAAPVLEELEAMHRDDSLGLHGSPGLCTTRATFARERGDAALATERYEGCLALFPEDPLLVDHAVGFFDEIGDTGRAEQVLRGALAARPTDDVLRARLVRRLLARGADSEAEEVVRAATELPHPSDAATGWANVALLELGRGDYEAAAEAFGRARELDPTGDPELAFGYADALVVAGHHDEALRVVADSPVSAYRALIEGRVALSRGDPDAAVEAFSEGVRLWPDNAIARYYLAVAAEQADDFPVAIENYRYAMRIDVRATDAYLRLARLHVASGDLEQALAMLGFMPGGRPAELEANQLQLELLMRRDSAPPAHLVAYFGAPERAALGAAAVARGVRAQRGPDVAVEALREHGKLDLEAPENAPALAELIESLAAAGKTEEGVAAADAAVRRHPDAAVLHALRGRALELAGAPSEAAVAAFERALTLDPEEERALAGLGRLAARRGEAEAALDWYDRALALDAEDRDVARAAASLLAAQGRREEAEARLEALLRAHPYDAEGATALVRLRVARGAEDATRTQRLARRAVSFGGGPEAEMLLASLEADASAPEPD